MGTKGGKTTVTNDVGKSQTTINSAEVVLATIICISRIYGGVGIGVGVALSSSRSSREREGE